MQFESRTLLFQEADFSLLFTKIAHDHLLISLSPPPLFGMILQCYLFQVTHEGFYFVCVFILCTLAFCILK